MSRRDNEAYRQPIVQRSKFTKEEDNRLLEIVRSNGSSDWELISKFLPGRNARQCRERWCNYVNPDIKCEPWTKEEDDLLISLMIDVGPKWKLVSSHFPQRPINSIKNRWTNLKKKQEKVTNNIQPMKERDTEPKVEVQTENQLRPQPQRHEPSFNIIEYIDSLFNGVDFETFSF